MIFQPKPNRPRSNIVIVTTDENARLIRNLLLKRTPGSFLGLPGSLLTILTLSLALVACDAPGTVSTGSMTEVTTSAESTADSGFTTFFEPTTTVDADTTIDDGATTGSSTGIDECMKDADCPSDACRTPIDCVAGLCVFEYMPEGEIIAEQTPGDCALIVCDGLGATYAQAEQGDPPDDGVACTVDTCDGVTPVHTSAQEACYSGSPATLGVGACMAGVRTCDVKTGDFGACEGEVGPKAEDCDAGHLDDDCDAEADESGPSCVCGDGAASVGEECDDGNTIDDGCSSSCKVQAVLEHTQGSWHGCARITGKIIKCWGANFAGQLGQGDTVFRGDEPDEMGDNLPSVNLGVGQVALGLSAGEDFTCALLTGGRIKCWGVGDNGVLGVGDTKWRGDQPGEMGDALPFVDLGQGVTATAITAGSHHTCALLAGGAIKCWGNNQAGQLGLGDDAYARGDQPGEMGDALPTVDLGPGAIAIAISAGWNHNCALLADGKVKCWGWNQAGQLGLGDHEHRGDGSGEMGADLPLVALGAPAVALSAGSYQTCALLMGGKVKCWGNNDFGELGLGDTIVRGIIPGQMGDALPTVDLGVGTFAISIHTHKSYTCAMLSDGKFKCWGWNGDGQLGLGDKANRGDDPGEMGDNLPVVDLGVGAVVVSLVTSAHTGSNCALLSDGSMKCWGMNVFGEQGLGDTAARGGQPGEMGDALPRIKLFSQVW